MLFQSLSNFVKHFRDGQSVICLWHFLCSLCKHVQQLKLRAEHSFAQEAESLDCIGPFLLAATGDLLVDSSLTNTSG